MQEDYNVFGAGEVVQIPLVAEAAFGEDINVTMGPLSDTLLKSRTLQLVDPSVELAEYTFAREEKGKVTIDLRRDEHFTFATIEMRLGQGSTASDIAMSVYSQMEAIKGDGGRVIAKSFPLGIATAKGEGGERYG